MEPNESEDHDFARWVTPHLVMAANFCTRLVGPDRRDDLLQDSLTRAWRKWASFDPSRGTPRAWLLAIVADQQRQEWRRVARRAAAPVLAAPPTAEAIGGTASVDTRIDLEVAIAQLARRQRLAVDLYYFVGLDVAETAQVMGCSVGTVKSTLADARSRLRAELEAPDGS